MRRARGAPRRGEPLSSNGASNGDGAVRCQLEGSRVPAKRVQQYGARGSDAWEAGGGRLAQQPRSTNTEDGDGVTVFRMPTVPILHLRRECNTRDQGHQGNYFTDRPKLATLC